MVIIIEGPDNVGKSTQIKLLMKNLIKHPTYTIHFSNVLGISNDESKQFSRILYNDMFHLVDEAFKFNRNIIFDRAHLGEYVYSPIYRNYSGEFIFEIENRFLNTSGFKSIVLFLMVDDPNKLIEREDGKSFSNKLHSKILEKNMFIEAYFKSQIKNKFLIDVNGRSITEIHNEILNDLNGITSEE